MSQELDRKHGTTPAAAPLPPSKGARTWQPSIAPSMLIQRAEALASVRDFFKARQVIEVDTPVCYASTITDVAIEGIAVPYHSQTLYLQTSPEYAMKRLLAAGAPDIYYLGKAFRQDEEGRFHNPEFTMLEWYRKGFSLHDLMKEVGELVAMMLQTPTATITTYQTVFEEVLQLNPHTITVEDCKRKADAISLSVSQGFDAADKDTWLQLLFSHAIEPTLGFEAPVMVEDFPASQAALATTHIVDGAQVARRFECYVRGIELANGYHELSDGPTLRQRFEADNLERQARGLPVKPLDERFLAAMAHGLPPCSGVALGFDRLLMLALDATDIGQVLMRG